MHPDVKKVAENTFDIDEYVVDVAKKEGLPHGMKSLPEGVTVHLACHARAQNMGPKAAEMLNISIRTLRNKLHEYKLQDP